MIDEDNRKYLSTSIGLMVIDGDREFILNSDFGLKENRIKDVIIDADGHVIVAQPSGMYSFPSNNLYKESVRGFKPLITEVWVDSSRMDISRDLFLPVNHHSLIINFSLPDYICDDQNSYSWKLSGYDYTFSASSSKSKVDHSNLPPGNYEFELKAWNAFGEQMDDVVPLKIAVPHRISETAWFKTLIIILAIGVGYWLVRIRIWVVQARNKELREKVKLRTIELETALEQLHSAKETEIEAAKLRSVQELAGGIAHELNQPLQALYSVADIVDAKNKNTKEEIELHLKIIPKAVERIGILVKKMLAITSVVEKTYTHNAKIIDLEKSANEIEENPLRSAENKTDG